MEATLVVKATTAEAIIAEAGLEIAATGELAVVLGTLFAKSAARHTWPDRGSLNSLNGH